MMTRIAPARRPDTQLRGVGAFRAVNTCEVELSQPLPDIPATEPANGQDYARARVLVRLHTTPMGLVELDVPREGLAASALARHIWATLAPRMNTHLREDGLEAPQTLDASGLPVRSPPECLRQRARFLADAPFLSVIIPTRERPDHVARCVRSILATGYPGARYEIIVADNAPQTNATAEVVAREFAHAPVRYIREDRSGSASARNRGLTIAEGEIVAFTDDDVIVDTHWLTELAHAFSYADETPISCVTGLVMPMELASQAQVWFEQYGGFSPGFERRLYNMSSHHPHTPLYPFRAGIFGTGNNMAFRRRALAEIGEFDPALGNGTPALGGVDSEALLRTILRGYTLLYEPSAIVHHAHRADYAGLRRQIYSYGVGLTAYYLKTLMCDPRVVPDFLRQIPHGLRFALSPHSSMHANKRTGYPRELTLLEFRGMLYGPLAYLRSRRVYGKHTPDTTAHERLSGHDDANGRE